MLKDFGLFFKITDGFAMSDITGWILAAFAGIIAYRLIDNMQTSMERHAMLAQIEDGFSALFDSVIAKSNGKDVMVRTVLHDDSPWQVITDKDGRIEFIIVNNQRYVHIRNTEKHDEWISTQALHEITLKARRIEKMYKAGLIRRIDLADMFRELTPFGASGRMEFIGAYYNAYDAECLAYLVMQTIVSCDKYGNNASVEYFTEYYKNHPDMHKYFEDNRRIRRILDCNAVRKFNKIVRKEVH